MLPHPARVVLFSKEKILTPIFCGIVYYRGETICWGTRWKLVLLQCLLSTINLPDKMVPDQQSCVAPHEAKRPVLEEVPGCLSLLLAGVPSQGSGQYLDWPDGHPVHPPKSRIWLKCCDLRALSHFG